MIAFKDNLPVIQLATGEAVAFEHEWLVGSLAEAARRAGYGKWWLAEHVAESVTSYLRDQREVTVMPIADLTRAVRSVLQVIGYAEVGQHFVPDRPTVRISLADLAREAGSGFEMLFFIKLAQLLRELVRQRQTHFELLGLEPCVKHITARRVWSRECNALRDEIVAFTREHAGTAAAQKSVSFSLQ